MARTRLIRAEACHDEAVASCKPVARLVWAYLPCHADREGRLEDKPFALKLAILPLDAVDMSAVLGELANVGLIQRYEVDGRRYIQIRTFAKHQDPHAREASSIIPAPCDQGAPRSALGEPRSALGEPRRVQAPLDPVSDPVPDPVSGPDQTQSVSPAGNAPSPKRVKKPRPAPEYAPEFERIWAETGRSGNKLPAFETWDSLGRPPPADVIAGWQHATRNDYRWRGADPHIPHLSTWLNARGWEDRPTKTPTVAPLSVDAMRAKEAEERERKRRAETELNQRHEALMREIGGGNAR